MPVQKCQGPFPVHKVFAEAVTSISAESRMCTLSNSLLFIYILFWGPYLAVLRAFFWL